MIRFTAIIKKFGEQGEKTGWSYIDVPSSLAEKLKPGNKKSFRVKGRLDEFEISMIALLPMGDGNFIMALNAAIRKGIRKQKGAKLEVRMEVDGAELKPPEELIECLEDEPKATAYFNGLAKSHQRYFINYINAAKTNATKAKRIAITINAFEKGWNYGQMLRASKTKS